MHALHYVAKAKGGRGQKGGLSEYAEATGHKEQNLRIYRDGAEVAQNLNIDIEVSELLKKAIHLAAIHKLPEEAWSVAVEAMFKKASSARSFARD